ncbi:hypothetical protein AGMMS49983_17840 [Clostridia bacterium]|nr:hypothetical protein AGMMS49983_17840 [Clostridia bacterium]
MNKIIFGQIGKLKKDKIAEYTALHANPWEGVLETMKRCNLQNYSIFLQEDFVFAYFEYVGDDYTTDMRKMAQDAITQEWWAHTKPCFIKNAFSEGGEFYKDMQSIFYLA